MNKKFVVFILLCLSLFSCSKVNNVSNRNMRIVGYLPLWETARWDSLDISSLSHCILSFATYSADGTIGWDVSDDSVRTLVTRCKENGVKPMVALGGFGGFNTKGNPFGSVEKRANIIAQISDIVGKYGLDGVDIDIEIVAKDSIWGDFDDFVVELRRSLGNERLITMAVGTWFTDSVRRETYQRLDFLNLMAYDNSFGDDDVAPVEMAHEMLDYYSERGVAAENLVLGVPFYGYSKGGVTRHWYEIIALDSANIGRDFDPVDSIYFNGVPTMKQKIEISRDYGGIMIWQIAEDDLGDYSMLKLIKNSL